MREVQNLNNLSIQLDYSRYNFEIINSLKNNQSIVSIDSSDQFRIENYYYKMKHPGSLPKVYTRKAVLEQLQKVADFLDPNFGLFIFDVFRTVETQTYLFEEFKKEIQAKHSELQGEALEKATRRYVSHPNDSTRHAPPPHNTGGAIDLALFDRKTGENLYFGGPIDLTDEISQTDYFEKDFVPNSGFTEEQWLTARKNRRLLFHAMIKFGFTSYENEWWHFDLGDIMWANRLNLKPVFDSLEEDVFNLKNCSPLPRGEVDKA